MRDELDVLIKARDDFQRLMGGDAAHIAVARDDGAFIDDLVRSGRVISDVDDAMLRDIVGPETAAAAKMWIHHLTRRSPDGRRDRRRPGRHPRRRQRARSVTTSWSTGCVNALSPR